MRNEVKREQTTQELSVMDCSYKLYAVADYLEAIAAIINNRTSNQLHIDLEGLAGYTLKHLSREVLEVAVALDEVDSGDVTDGVILKQGI